MTTIKTEKRVAFIKGDQLEARKAYILVVKAAMKQPKVMILKTSKVWDRRRERRIEPMEELVKVELEVPEKATMVNVELTGIKVAKNTELLRKNRSEFA